MYMNLEVITEDIIKHYLSKNCIVFKSTQNRLSLPIINRLYKKMKNGIRFDDIKICDNLIIDGHHRYISSLLAGFKIQTINSHKTSATNIFEWDDIRFLDIEWDTKDKIQYLNELDAIFNKIPVEKIIEIIK